MLMMRLLLRINRMLRMLHLLPSHLRDNGDDEEESSEDDEDDDMDIKADEEEEHPATTDSVVVASTAADQALSTEETEPFKSDESAATPPPHLAYRMTARISIPAPVPVPAWSDSEIVRLLAMSSPPASPLSPWSSPPPQIPFPPLPPILSPPSPMLSPAPPPSPIRSLGYRAIMIRLRAEAASTSHSLPLPSPFILSPTRSDAPSSGTPLLLPISASTSSPPLQLPSASCREDRPEVTLPPRKSLGISLGPGYEVGESLSAAAARLARGLRADYGFVATMDREIMHDPEREVGYGITDSWDEIVRQDTDKIYMRLDDEQTERQLLAGWLNMLFRDRHAHAYTRHLMKTEARMSREAWVRSTDAGDLVRGEGEFQMSSMRELTFFLGLQVKQKDDGIFISQDKYVAKILRKFGLTDGKLASTPIDTEKPLLKDPDGDYAYACLDGKPFGTFVNSDFNISNVTFCKTSLLRSFSVTCAYGL
nr:copia protein [Tanacetum cinerariifolium]